MNGIKCHFPKSIIRVSSAGNGNSKTYYKRTRLMRPRLNSFGNHISQTSYEANTVQSLILTWFEYVACIHSLSIKCLLEHAVSNKWERHRTNPNALILNFTWSNCI